MNNKVLLSAFLIAGTLSVTAQSNKYALAITGDGSKDFTWMNIRQVDLSSGKIVNTIFERSKSDFTLTNINTKKTINQSATFDNIFADANYPTGTFVAAAAFDQRSNKLFFTPMRKGELRWLDLNAPSGSNSFYSLALNDYKTTDPNDEATNITRMVIGANGYGYALSNDGNHFFRFTTGKKPIIEDLGNIIDADVNKGMSIHNRCSCWGGDMIADAFGKLYVISANHAVFVIDPETRIATYLGNIDGLPVSFTTNAAAVNEEGNVVVASANFFDGCYVFDINTLKANKIIGSESDYSISDFANSNLLFQKEANSLANTKAVPLPNASVDAKIFPNPVVNNSFNILLNNQAEGKYTVVVSDLTGRPILSQVTTAFKGAQTEKVKMNRGLAKGIYFVKVFDENNIIVVNEKIIVQ